MPRLLCAFLFVAMVQGAEFVSGQAARAVLGQPSFSAHEQGVSPSAMAISDGLLYVADHRERVLAFDLTAIPEPKEDLGNRVPSGCPVCGFAPSSSVAQQVAPGSATVSVHGKSLAAIDSRGRRVLVWNDVTTTAASSGPDVILDISDGIPSVISESTLIDPVSIALDGTRLFIGDAALHRVLVWNSLPSTDNQPADLVLGQRDFSSREAAEIPRADSIYRPDTLVSDGLNLYVGDTRDHRILVFSPADSPLTSGEVTNSATLSSGGLAPGTLVTLTGAGLADRTASSPDGGTKPLPVKLAGVEVFLNGVPLPLLSVGPKEIRTQISYASGSTSGVSNATSASLYIREEHVDGTVTTTNAAQITLTSASPGLFAFGGNEPRAAILLHASMASGSESGTPVSAEDPAEAGEAVTVWVTGLHVLTGTVDQGPVAGSPYSGSDLSFTPIHASVNGIPADVVGAALPETSVGVYQLRIVLPSGIQTQTAQLSISQDGSASNTVSFPVKKSAL